MKQSRPSNKLHAAAASPAPGGQVVHLPLIHDKAAVTQPGTSQSRSLWYAVYFPQLESLPEPQQQQHLQQLADLAGHASANVSLGPASLLLEIRSSLKYFGGIDSLHSELKSHIATQLRSWQLPEDFHYAASPTATASLWLARSAHSLLVYRRKNLRTALGQLSTEVLNLGQEQSRRLHNMGIRYLRDIWRLPEAGLRKRFGSQFINQLRQALGKQPEPMEYYQPPPAFNIAYELPCETEELNRLLPVIDEFCAQLVDFLCRRDLSISQLSLSLLHEQQDVTQVNLALRRPTRSPVLLLQLLMTRLDNLVIPAPVTSLQLAAQRFDAYAGRSGDLIERHPTQSLQHDDQQFNQFLEQLQARLGAEPVQGVTCNAEHCPEYACSTTPFPELAGQTPSRPVASNPRPLWLLAEPQRLKIRNGRLHYRQPISILSGPERIESRWWSGQDVRRDYYVAREESGSRLWIYHEKAGQRRWYLHGIFA